MKYKLPKLFYVFIFLLATSYASGQEIIVKCGKLTFTIPQFYQSDWNSLNNQFAVKAKIVKPITTSKSIVEIRVYRYGFGQGMVDVISCSDDSLVAIRYVWLNKTTQDDYLNGSDPKYLLIKNGALLKFNPAVTTQSFLSSLFNSHIADIPSQDGLNLKILRENPKTEIVPADGGGKTVFEIKINDRFRVLEYYNDYNPQPMHIADYRNFQQISKLFNDLKLP